MPLYSTLLLSGLVLFAPKATALAPCETFLVQGRHALDLEQRDAALRSALEALKTCPADQQAHELYQDAQISRAQGSRMVREYRALHQQHPREPIYAYLLARALLATNLQELYGQMLMPGEAFADLEEVTRLVEEAASTMANSPQLLMLQARLEQDRGETKKRLELLERAHKLAPDDLEVSRNLLRARVSTQWPQAKALCESLLERTPPDVAACAPLWMAGKTAPSPARLKELEALQARIAARIPRRPLQQDSGLLHTLFMFYQGTYTS